MCIEQTRLTLPASRVWRRVTQRRSAFQGLPAAIAFASLALCYSTDTRAEDIFGVLDPLTKVDLTSRDELISNIAEGTPKQVLNEQDAEFAAELISAGKTTYDIEKKIYQGKEREAAEDVARMSAEATRDRLISEIEKRYPDEEAPVRKVLSTFKDNPELTSKIAKAVLDGDPKTVMKHVGDEIDKHAADKYAELVANGINFWTSLVNSLVPGSDVLKQKGINVAQTYVDGSKRWATFIERSKRAAQNLVFDCAQKKYVSIASIDGPEAARDSLLSTGLRGFDCGGVLNDSVFAPDETDDAQRTRGFLRDVAQMYRDARTAGARLTRDTSALAEFGIDRSQLVSLIEQFENAKKRAELSRTEAGDGFAKWLRSKRPSKAQSGGARRQTDDGFWATLRDIGRNSGVSFIFTHVAKKYEGSDLQRLVAAMQDLHDVLLDAAKREIRNRLDDKQLTELARKPPTEDYLPVDEVKEFSEGINEERSDKRGAGEAELPKRKAERDCKPKPANVGNGGLDDEFVGQENYATGQSSDDDCQRETAVYQYEPPERVKKDPGSQPTRCAALNTRVDQASIQFNAGRVKDAHETLQTVLADMASLPVSDPCGAVRKRAEGNADKVIRVITLIASVKDALTTCDTRKVERHANILEGAANVRLAALRNRTLRSKPVATKYTAARMAFRRGDIGSAENLFRTALDRAEQANGKTCKNIASRIRNNLKRIASLKEISQMGSRVAAACDTDGIKDLRNRLHGSTNPHLDKVYDRLTSALAKCNKVAAKTDCQETRGAGYYAGPVDKNGNYFCLPTKATANAECRRLNKGVKGMRAGTIKSDGGFDCVQSEKGRRQTARASCRRQYGKRYVKTTFRKNGSYDCHFCNPGSYPRKGRCYTPGKQRKRTAYKCPRGYVLRGKTCYPRNRPSPQYDPAAAAKVIQGIQQLQRGIQGLRGGRGYSGGGGGCANPRAPGC